MEPRDSGNAYEHEDEARREQRLQKLYTKGNKLMNELEHIWSKSEDLEGET